VLRVVQRRTNEQPCDIPVGYVAYRTCRLQLVDRRRKIFWSRTKDL
jgi:hypothetical protein